MSKTIRLCRRSLRWLQQAEEDERRQQEVCCPGQGQERQGQDRPLW